MQSLESLERGLTLPPRVPGLTETKMASAPPIDELSMCFASTVTFVNLYRTPYCLAKACSWALYTFANFLACYDIHVPYWPSAFPQGIFDI